MRTFVAALVLCIGVAGLCAEDAKPAAPRIDLSSTATFKFVEKFTRTHKKIKENPFFFTAPRSRIEPSDKGTFSLIGTLKTPSAVLSAYEVNPSQFGFDIFFNNAVVASFFLTDDPDWEPGKKKAKFETKQTFNGKTIQTSKIQISWDEEEMRFSVKGTYVATDDGSVGQTLLAQEYLTNGEEVAGVADCDINFGLPSTLNYVANNQLVPFAGVVKRTPFMDTGATNLKMGFVGSNATK
jgi:hypothetical protein